MDRFETILAIVCFGLVANCSVIVGADVLKERNCHEGAEVKAVVAPTVPEAFDGTCFPGGKVSVERVDDTRVAIVCRCPAN